MKNKRHNLTYAKARTKRRKQLFNWKFKVLASTFILLAVILSASFKFEALRPLQALLGENILAGQNEASVELIDINAGVIREVTAYNAGDPNQTDDSPCISASGDDICKLLEEGQRICAANFVPLGDMLYVDNYGECLVLDRMNSRFQNRVDIAMRLDEKERAINFGRQNLLVMNLTGVSK